jgi:hypothetical protein
MENQTVSESVMSENKMSESKKENDQPPPQSSESPTSNPPVQEPFIPHPLEDYDYFSEHPPIPTFNYIINSKTLEIIEDLTGKP